MKKIHVLFFALAVLGGCATPTPTPTPTTANYEKIIDSWLGASEIDLIRSWGPPQRSYEAGGTKFIAYIDSRNVQIDGIAPSYQTSIIGNTAYTEPVGGTSSLNLSFSCETTFEISNGRIVGWRYQGNNCKALEP